jgi:hypothetical protein
MLTSGVLLGPYEIVSLLGSGGMGEVYRARDTRLNRLVAVKVLPPHLAADPQFRQRFEHEARAISALDHPHICALYDVGEEQGRSYLVMQFLEGETLESRLKKGGLPLDSTRQVRSAPRFDTSMPGRGRHGVGSSASTRRRAQEVECVQQFETIDRLDVDQIPAILLTGTNAIRFLSNCKRFADSVRCKRPPEHRAVSRIRR